LQNTGEHSREIRKRSGTLFRDITQIVILSIFVFISLLLIVKFLLKRPIPYSKHLNYLWIFFLFFCVSAFFSFSLGIWVLAFLCFWALREYFSLIDLRPEDRWGILAAYISVPFMIYMIQIDWYGMFIISIPVYAFLLIPFLLALGGDETRGAVFSIGAIDFGLFLTVYCLGHMGYLALYSIPIAVMLIINIAFCDVIKSILQKKEHPTLKKWILRYAVPLPLTVTFTVLIRDWTHIPLGHSLTLGLLIPALISISNFTIDYLEFDLGVKREEILPGKGEILDSIKSIFYTAPIVLHYVRYFLDEYNL